MQWHPQAFNFSFGALFDNALTMKLCFKSVNSFKRLIVELICLALHFALAGAR
jgi:hypothetical protein